jgi:hypothetical protein
MPSLLGNDPGDYGDQAEIAVRTPNLGPECFAGHSRAKVLIQQQCHRTVVEFVAKETDCAW